MGTDLENVLEDLTGLQEHFNYFIQCKQSEITSLEVDKIFNLLRDLAVKIENKGN